MRVLLIQNVLFMQADSRTIHDTIHDVWDMEVSFDDEVKQSFYGSKTRTIAEVLLGTKKYMEDKKNERHIKV